MEKLLIAATTQAYGATIAAPTVAEGAVTPDLLAPGSLAIYGFHRFADGFSKFALLTNAAATAGSAGSYKANVDDFNGDTIQFYLGTASGNPRQATPMQLRGIKRIEANDYQAPVKQILTVQAPAVPTTRTARDEYILTVDVLSKMKREDNDHMTFNVVGNYASITLLVDAFVAALNARPNMPFVATRSGSGDTSKIVLTAKNELDSMQLFFDELMLGATYVETAAMSPGSGSYRWITAKEKNTRGENGYFNQIDTRDKAIALLAVDGAKYDIYLIDFVNKHVLKDESDDTFSDMESLIVAVPDGSSQGTVLQAIFNQFYEDGKIPAEPFFNSAAETVGETTTTTTTGA